MHKNHSIVHTLQNIFVFEGEREYSNNGSVKGTAKVYSKTSVGKKDSVIYEGEVYVPMTAIQFTEI